MKQSILEHLKAEGVDISSSCGGMGTCGTCRVIVVQGLECLSERNEVEAEMASERQFHKEERLACQNFWNEKIKLKIPQRSI